MTMCILRITKLAYNEFPLFDMDLILTILS